MISQGSLSWAIQSSSHFSAFRYHHVSSSKRHFYLLIRFSCGHGWLRLHTWWWMIWCHMIFWPTTHLMPYWGIFPFWLRFVDLHWFSWSSLVMRCTPTWWFAFILSWFSNGTFLESFSQARAFWYCCDSWTKLSQVHRLPYHRFNGVHVRFLIHPMELFSSDQDRPDALVAILGHISLFLAVEMIVFSQTCYSLHYSAEGYLFALLATVLMIFAEMSLQ